MNANPSPLFEPAVWEGHHFRILDETQLPWKLEYITVREVSEAVRAVKEMRTRAFGQVLTFLYALALPAEGANDKKPGWLEERLERLAGEFSQARPTFDFRGLSASLSRSLQGSISVGDRHGWLKARVLEIASRMREARLARARHAAQMLPGRCRLLTHCNMSGELVAVARFSKEMGKEISIIATETRPYLQGSRLTCWEIARAGIEVALIPDCAIAQVMAKGEVDCVLVGSDRVAQNGDIVNKVGTYPIALMAKRYGLPFYVLVQEPGELETGEDAVIEERPVGELFALRGRPLAPASFDGVQGRYPAFDVTPAGLIAALIGFGGAMAPEAFRERYQKRPPSTEGRSKVRARYLLLYGVPRESHFSYLAQALRMEHCGAVFVPEMRPGLLGLHAVAGELRKRKIPVTLISDNMMGAFFARGQIARLYLFYSGITGEGVEGIPGSLLAVNLACAHRIPVELLAGGGAKAAPDRDVSTFLGERVSPEGVAIYPIEKELVPWAPFMGGSS